MRVFLSSLWLLFAGVSLVEEWIAEPWESTGS